MKNKRLIIILGVMFFIAFIVVLSSTVFTLQNVEIVFGYTLNSETTHFGTEEKCQAVINTGNFDYNSCIFFVDKETSIQYLETYNPYLEVINIETTFPNKLIIHAVEREELYSVWLGENSYAVTDDSLKVLDITSVARGVTVFGTLTTGSVTAEEGKILDVIPDYKCILSDIYRALSQIGASETEDGYTVADITATFEKVQLNYDTSGTLMLKTYQGTELMIKVPENGLFKKIWQAVSAFETSASIYDTITVEDILDENGYYIFYAE